MSTINICDRCKASDTEVTGMCPIKIYRVTDTVKNKYLPSVLPEQVREVDLCRNCLEIVMQTNSHV